MEQWAARVAPGMTPEQWATAETITRGAWDESCGDWLVWVQRTAPPRGPFNLPPWGKTLAKVLLDHRAAADLCDLCGDDQGRPTGWAAERNPGTGCGGRDEEIGVPCPNGCPDSTEPPADPEQRPVNLAHVSLNGDGSVTTVFPNGTSIRTKPGELSRVTVTPRPSEYNAATWPKSQEALDDLAATLAANDAGAKPTAAQGVVDDQGEDGRF